MLIFRSFITVHFIYMVPGELYNTRHPLSSDAQFKWSEFGSVLQPQTHRDSADVLTASTGWKGRTEFYSMLRTCSYNLNRRSEQQDVKIWSQKSFAEAIMPAWHEGKPQERMINIFYPWDISHQNIPPVFYLVIKGVTDISTQNKYFWLSVHENKSTGND